MSLDQYCFQHKVSSCLKQYQILLRPLDILQGIVSYWIVLWWDCISPTSLTNAVLKINIALAWQWPCFYYKTTLKLQHPTFNIMNYRYLHPHCHISEILIVRNLSVICMLSHLSQFLFVHRFMCMKKVMTCSSIYSETCVIRPCCTKCSSWSTGSIEDIKFKVFWCPLAK